jgi:hypothetical protein
VWDRTVGDCSVAVMWSAVERLGTGVWDRTVGDCSVAVNLSALYRLGTVL